MRQNDIRWAMITYRALRRISFLFAFHRKLHSERFDRLIAEMQADYTKESQINLKPVPRAATIIMHALSAK